MSRNDDGFNLDDMMEIFGEALPASAKAPVVTPPPPPVSAPSASSAQVSDLSQEEQALLAAYEMQKRERKQQDDDAKARKDAEAARILADYEKAQTETRARLERERQEVEEKRARELEELKQKQELQANAQRLAEEERRIIEQYEKDEREKKIRLEQERQAKEAAAQAELQELAEKQKAEQARRQVEDAAKEAEMQAQAAALSSKDNRLIELMAKAQQDLQAESTVAAAAPAEEAVAPSFPDIDQAQNEAFCSMLDETRKAMFTFLAPLIGIKASNNMLNKSVEKARSKSPVVLKDANWHMDGSLREDGSVDPERIFKNLASLKPETRIDDYLGAFRELVSLRVRAVEAGLGVVTATDMGNKLSALRTPLTQANKFNKEWVDLFFTRVL